jgi:hypothetical protein
MRAEQERATLAMDLVAANYLSDNDFGSLCK